MSDATTEPKVTAASDVEVDRETLDASIRKFAEVNGDYYVQAFHKIHDDTGLIPRTFNIWAAVRSIWGMFWAFLILEVIAWVQIGRGLWGNPGAEFAARAAKQQERAEEFRERAAAAREAGEDPSRFETLAETHPGFSPRSSSACPPSSASPRSGSVCGWACRSGRARRGT